MRPPRPAAKHTNHVDECTRLFDGGRQHRTARTFGDASMKLVVEAKVTLAVGFLRQSICTRAPSSCRLTLGLRRLTREQPCGLRLQAFANDKCHIVRRWNAHAGAGPRPARAGLRLPAVSSASDTGGSSRTGSAAAATETACPSELTAQEAAATMPCAALAKWMVCLSSVRRVQGVQGPRVQESKSPRVQEFRIARGQRHTKLAASSTLPLPLYCATCGCGHSGRVRSTRPSTE